MGFAGGFTLGVVQAGFKLVGKREMKGGFGVANCEANRHLLGDEWHAEANDPSTWSVPSGGVDVVFGNPPCSGFSVMSAKSFRGADSKINHCMWAFADYVVKARPTIAVFESVQPAFTRPDGHDLMRRLRAHVEEGTGDRWTLYHVRHNAYSVGGPSQRRRYFWLISRVPFGIERPRPKVLPLLNDVIGDIANLGRSWYPQSYRAPAHEWTEHLRSPSGSVDGHVDLDSPLNRRMRDIMSMVAWLPGEHIAVPLRRCYETHGRLPESIGNATKIIATNFSMGFTTPTRWRGDHPARVITGGGLTLVIHPWLNRTLTHREVTRIMGFPDDWRILPLRGTTGLSLTWGKGITVHCGRWVGRWIKAALDGEPGSYTGQLIGEREYDIDVTNDWKFGSTTPTSRIHSTINTRQTETVGGTHYHDRTNHHSRADLTGRRRGAQVGSRSSAL